MRPPDVKRAARCHPETARWNTSTDKPDPTAATPAAQRCRVVVYYRRRPLVWGRYPAWEAAASVVATLQRNGFDARMEVDTTLAGATS